MDQPKNFINLIGQTFCELYVFERAGSDNDGSARFLARCSCGNEGRYDSIDLRRFKRTAYPKCLREAGKRATIEKREAAAQKFLEEKIERNKEKYDISGLKIKDWTVIEPVKFGRFGSLYVCQCECGALFNFSRNAIVKSKITQKCQGCLQKRRDEERLTKIDDVKKSGKFICRSCGGNFEIKDISPSNLDKGDFCCNSCHKASKDQFLNGWKNSHLEKDFLECSVCSQEIKIEDFRPSSLKAKHPKCNECKDKETELAKDGYELKNKAKSFIECCKCGANKTIDSYYDSSLRFSSPKCKECLDLDKKSYHRIRSKKDPIYKEKYDIGRKIAQSLDKRGWKKDATAATYLGIDKDGFLKHIESLFREGMSFENRGEWHLDHVTPLSTAETLEDIKRLWHYTNLQPLWKSENEEKSNLLDWRDRFEWAKEVVEIRKKNGLE